MQQLEPVQAVVGIESFQADAECHVKDSDNDRGFHFDGVEELDLLNGEIPDWVYADGIDTIRRVFCACFEVIATLEKVQWYREEIIVD